MKSASLWVAISVVAVAVIIWNFRTNNQIRKQNAICQELENEIAQCESKAQVLKEFSDQRTQANESAEADRSSLFAMYSVCRSAEDFIPIHPDQIQCVNHGFHLETEYLFYVPPGKHELGARFSSVDADTAKENSDPKLREFWGDSQEGAIELEGGKSYRALLSFYHNGNPVKRMFPEKASMMRVSISEDQFVEFSFEPSEITHVARYMSNADGGGQSGMRLGLPGQVSNFFYRQLIIDPSQLGEPKPEFDLTVIGRGQVVSEKHEREIRLRLFIKSEGPAKVLPTSKYFCEDLFGPYASKKSLDYLQYDEAQGWYYYRNPVVVKRSDSDQEKIQ